MLNIKKTLLITIDFPPKKGGVANYLSNLSDNLPNDKIIVLANNYLETQSFDSKQKYKIIRADLYYKNFWPRWLKTFYIAKKIIKKEGIEQVIISHIIPMGYIAVLLNLPFHIIFHGYDILLAKQSTWKKMWLRKILNKSKHIIVNSNFTKELILQEDIKSEKITIVHPCTDILNRDLKSTETELIRQELELTDKKILISVGRIIPRKGFDKVIEALPKVTQKYPDLIYLIIGDGEYKNHLDQLAQKLKVRGNLIFLKDVSDSNLPCYYQLADIFIMPSRIENKTDVEGFGIVYLEANAFAKPVIAGDSGGIKDAVIDNQTGILVNPENVQGISNAILDLFDNPAKMNKLGEQGKKRVETEFLWPIQISKLKNIL